MTRPVSLLNAVLDGGINLIDTSIDYGRSEELIGRYVGHRRDEYFLASKCGCLIGDPPAGATPPFPHDFRPENIRAGIEQSLRRLDTDRLDLLQVHISPSRDRLEADGTVETMLALRDEGKVRFVGMSGTLPHLPDHIAMGVFDVFQIPYSAVQREHESLITAAAQAGAGTLIRGGAARGAPAEDKQWRQGPIGLSEGEGPTPLGGLGSRGPARRHEPSWSSCSASPSAIPACPAPSSGLPASTTCASNLAIAEKGPLPADLYQEAKRRLDPVSP